MSNKVLSANDNVDDKLKQRKLVIRVVGMTAGFILFLVFLGIACATTTMDAQNHVHTNWWLLAIAFFWAMVFMYHIGFS
ncbi:hypothetical protein AA106555_1780 [Neokomagataea thailandica NBRC 106555]|uniref:Uncharacterized protein n=2 Tax=Neokomagataea TaxID=1223423 RepID=A0A4Y6V780_9PROT|nr:MULTISPECIES: hypothetical protein [Neokomagataea]QDH25234.1 hypothetical protein D5366_08420 [Neokomagataea tanensis]GBR54692.1 hypothetical protein AA106555_1780 [Neokomagataea thailandica NBRC 106555]